MAVKDCSVDVRVGERCQPLLGGAGSGKTTLAMALMGALAHVPGAHVTGDIRVLGVPVAGVSTAGERVFGIAGEDCRAWCSREPGSSLRPLRRIGARTVEVLQLVLGMSKTDAVQRSLDLGVGFRRPAAPSWQLGARLAS